MGSLVPPLKLFGGNFVAAAYACLVEAAVRPKPGTEDVACQCAPQSVRASDAFRTGNSIAKV